MIKRKLTPLQEFNKLSIKQQRIKIIKDAIKQIEIGKIKASPGCYMQLTNYAVDGRYEEDLQKILHANGCKACAKGALFASCVLITDEVNTDQDYSDNQFQSHKLRKWFKKGELDTIETALERRVVHDDGNILSTTKRDNTGYRDTDYKGAWTNLAWRGVAFGKRYRSPKKRLIAILKNTLRNGHFKP